MDARTPGLRYTLDTNANTILEVNQRNVVSFFRTENELMKRSISINVRIRSVHLNAAACGVKRHGVEGREKIEIKSFDPVQIQRRAYTRA